MKVIEILPKFTQWETIPYADNFACQECGKSAIQGKDEYFRHTKEQQALWRKEIEQACISGGYNGLDLAKDPRYKENLEVKEVDLEKEIKEEYLERRWYGGKNNMLVILNESQFNDIAKHFFELGMRVNNPITAADRGMAEEIIINLKRVEQDYRIDLTKEIEWVRSKVKKGV